MLSLEIAAAICCAIGVSVFIVWTVFQCADRESDQEPVAAQAQPLLQKRNDPVEFTVATSSSNNRNNKNSSSSSNGSTKASSPAPAVIPKFTNRVDGTNPSGGIKFSEKSVIFCKCGGGSPVIKLLPCGHNSLCLHCAQLEKACPTCNTVITDSVPSFRDISV